MLPYTDVHLSTMRCVLSYSAGAPVFIGQVMLCCTHLHLQANPYCWPPAHLPACSATAMLPFPPLHLLVSQQVSGTHTL